MTIARRDGAALDPASLQVLVARCAGIAEEMGAVLQRGAFSPNIKERADCSTALFTASGELLAQAEHIPVHLGSMPAAVAAAIAACGREVGHGDQIVVNDPFAGGTHLNDVTLVAPAFLGDVIVGWAANRAHHADVGGTAPGSMPPDALEIHEEGLRLPPTRLDPDVSERFVTASRAPEERHGDLAAQVGANRIGTARLVELVQRLGGTRGLEDVVDYGERRMRAALRDLPDGTFTFSDVVDSVGPRPGQQVPAVVRVTVTIRGERITFDFTGSSPQQPGNMNAVEAVTVSAVAFALRSVTDPTIPANGGVMRPVEVIAPAGTIVAAEYPAAVGAGNVEVSQRIADVCLGALAQAAPDRVGAAGQGTMNNVLVGGDGWVYYETVGGGQGGRPARAGMSSVHTGMTNTSQVDSRSGPPVPGMSAVHTGMTNSVDEGRHSTPPRPGQSGIHTAMTNSKNTPVEVLERTYPLRVLRYSIRRGSGGAGAAPGGDGIERDLLVLQDVTVSLITERRMSRPWGLAGGEPGATGENWLLPGGDEGLAERLPDKCTLQLRTGDVLRMLTPGGGGWGPAG
jgi:N-methylhydantoinase B/oxoprolinase/acetone carboxylase alpha subunit